MNTFIWIGVVILLLGWIGLFVIAFSYKFEEDKLDSLDLKFLQKTNPDNPPKSGMPE